MECGSHPGRGAGEGGCDVGQRVGRYVDDLVFREVEQICAWVAKRMEQEAVLMMVTHSSYLIRLVIW